jgi:hypothetical protein
MEKIIENEKEVGRINSKINPNSPYWYEQKKLYKSFITQDEDDSNAVEWWIYEDGSLAMFEPNLPAEDSSFFLFETIDDLESMEKILWIAKDIMLHNNIK